MGENVSVCQCERNRRGAECSLAAMRPGFQYFWLLSAVETGGKMVWFVNLRDTAEQEV